jgi:hypothetical protein
MSSDEEVERLAPTQRSLSQTRLQNLLFPRGKAQAYMPLTSLSPRRRSSYIAGPSQPEHHRRRTQALLDRSATPAHSWDKFRVSDDDLKAIKKKKIRQFYENQVFHLGLERN